MDTTGGDDLTKRAAYERDFASVTILTVRHGLCLGHQLRSRPLAAAASVHEEGCPGAGDVVDHHAPHAVH